MKSPLRKQELSVPFIRTTKVDTCYALVWDTLQPGLALRVHPGGRKTYVVVYRYAARSRWFTIGSTERVRLADARAAARNINARVVLGGDPQGEKMAARAAARTGDTLRDVCACFVELIGKKRKAWQQGDANRKKHLLPRLGDRKIATITRADIERVFDTITASGTLSTANQMLAHASAVFGWALKKGLIAANPCLGIARNITPPRERVLDGDEVAAFWNGLGAISETDAASLKVLLLLGQRPGEIRLMRQRDLRVGEFTFEQHRSDGRVVKIKASGAWWHLPGASDDGWGGTKNGHAHRVWIPESVLAIFRRFLDGKATHVFHQTSGRPIGKLHGPMRAVCDTLAWKGSKRATPHDLRRTHGTTVTSLGFTREQMNRLQNHIEGGIADVYDRHQYEDEMRRIMEAVAARLLALAEGRADTDNVIELQSGKT